MRQLPRHRPLEERRRVPLPRLPRGSDRRRATTRGPVRRAPIVRQGDAPGAAARLDAATTDRGRRRLVIAVVFSPCRAGEMRPGTPSDGQNFSTERIDRCGSRACNMVQPLFLRKREPTYTYPPHCGVCGTWRDALVEQPNARTTGLTSGGRATQITGRPVDDKLVKPVGGAS